MDNIYERKTSHCTFSIFWSIKIWVKKFLKSLRVVWHQNLSLSILVFVVERWSLFIRMEARDRSRKALYRGVTEMRDRQSLFKGLDGFIFYHFFPWFQFFLNFIILLFRVWEFGIPKSKIPNSVTDLCFGLYYPLFPNCKMSFRIDHVVYK